MSTMLTINVTQDHIEKGEKEHWYTCPVALAFIDAGVMYVEVHGFRAEVEFPQGSEGESIRNLCTSSYVLPYSVGEWIGRFDLGEFVKPFTFDLSLN